MKCYNCGATIPDGAKYCLNCGRKMGDGGNGSSSNFEGKKECLDASKKRKGTRITFPPLLQWIFSIALILLLVIVFLHFK